ncbi:MAG: glycerophosphoryl diester phosphodiesterase [Actinomycetota bacterium]|jgi:glycerophosphoryl diester phosphodiesterase|nr:glycerophosphoryl diester phosphodiesterase [Actinomycetota bacterium]
MLASIPRRTLALGVCLLAFAAWFGSSSPVGAAANAWTGRRVLNIAHQGGENEAPSNTLFAFKTSLPKGSDVLELDVHATADRELVVLHDATVDRTTDGTGRVDELTLEQIKQFDAAYEFVPECGTCGGRPDSEKTFRGIATGDKTFTEEEQLDFEEVYGQRFEPNDFTIPTLREILETFPDQLMNIEIKETAPDTEPYEKELADLLQEFGRTDDTIVVSFIDSATEVFKVYAPEVNTATGTAESGAFWATAQGPLPGSPSHHQALQVPVMFPNDDGPITVVTPEFIQRAHANGLAVHVWTVNDEASMRELIAWGVDGIMSDYPTLLESVLTDLDVVWEPTP